MNIGSIGFDRYQAIDRGHWGRSHRTESGVGEVRKKTQSQIQVEEPAQDPVAEPPVADEPEPTEGEETQELRGVLRLLQAGHFQGVADLRLRINFFDELGGVELPELSAPKGNGKAYEKFLQIYQDMQQTDEVETPDDTDPADATPEPVETPENTDPLDAVA